MKVFDAIDRENASMFQWIRDTCSKEVFESLTGVPWVQSAADRENAFRAAFYGHLAKLSREDAEARELEDSLNGISFGDMD